MNAKIRARLALCKRRITRRLDKSDLRGAERPMFTASNTHYEIADPTRGLAHGGIGAIHLLVRQLGLAEAIDRHLHVLKIHRPYDNQATIDMDGTLVGTTGNCKQASRAWTSLTRAPGATIPWF